MSFLLKSVLGLGAVYAAMFGPAVKSGDLDSKAALCAIAAHAPALNGDEAGLRGQLLAAGCALSFNDATQRLAASLAAPPAPAPAPPQTKLGAGTLTADDLREPWAGFDPRPRKPRRRG